MPKLRGGDAEVGGGDTEVGNRVGVIKLIMN